MFMHAKSGTLRLRSGSMDYIRFGSGGKTLIILPGLGDSLRSIKIGALPTALAYREFGRHYTVYAFSRKHPLAPGCTSRDLALDQAEAMDALGIGRADLVGISMGGMISQQLASLFPERIRRLVLVVTCARPNPLLAESVNEWMDCARQNDHTALMESNLRRIYTPDYCRKNGWLVPVLGLLTKPKSYERFLTQAEICLKHNAFANLEKIQADTLVIGGEKDDALGGDPSRELAAAIPKARLKMYPDLGHGLYDEAKDFKKRLLDFFLEDRA